MTTPLLFAPGESRDLAAAVALHAGFEQAPLEERWFEDREFKLRPLVSVRDRNVVVVQTLASSAEASAELRMIRLLFLLAGLRDAGAARVTALVPYLAYARKDRRTQPRDPVTTRHVAQLLECTGLSHLICMDVHSATALDNAFRIPVDHLSAIPMLARRFIERSPQAELAVASPDIGGVKRAQSLREMLEAELGREVPLVFVEKRRSQGRTSGGQVVGDARGRQVIVLDDLCATGGTLIAAARALGEAGAAGVHVAVTHAPLMAGIARVAAEPAVSSVTITDSVGPALRLPAGTSSRVEVMSIAALLGEVLARLARGAPIAPLLQRWPASEG